MSDLVLVRKQSKSLLDHTVNLALDVVIYLPESLARLDELVSISRGVWADGEIVVRAAIAEVKASRNSIIGFDGKGKLGKEAFSSG